MLLKSYQEQNSRYLHRVIIVTSVHCIRTKKSLRIIKYTTAANIAKSLCEVLKCAPKIHNIIIIEHVMISYYIHMSYIFIRLDIIYHYYALLAYYNRSHTL